MKRSVSQIQINPSTLNRQISNQCIYINQQTKKTEKSTIQTIFHSPYKDGRRNKDFCNPTFMTSDVIWNRQFSPYRSNTPKKAIIHTNAQKRHKALYNQRMNRMNRSQSFTTLQQRIRQNSKSLKKKVAIRAEQGKNTKVIMSSKLQAQLQNLQNYRKQRQLKQLNRDPKERFFRKAQKNGKKQLPAYFQKVYQNPYYVEQQQSKRRQQLKQWLFLSKQLKQIKQQIKKQKYRVEVNAMTKNVQNFQMQEFNRQLQTKRNRQLLNKVLLDQIRIKQRQSLNEKRQKGWRVF